MSGDTAPRFTVDLDALVANFKTLKHAAGGVEVAPVVNADAYGIGLETAATRLWRDGARRFFVARVEEGVALRTVLGQPEQAHIYVFEGVFAADADLFARHGLIPALNSLEQVATWRATVERSGRRLPAVLQVDTGLNRLGLSGEDAEALAAAPDRLAGIEVEMVLSHLACADTPANPMNTRQAERFAALTRLFPHARTSLAATAGLFLGRAFHGDIVRPGIGLYGAGAPGRGLTTVATLDAPILQVRDIRAGDTVGYGASFVAERPMRVAILGVGYADGVLRAQGGRGYGWFAGARRALLGRISMDLTAVDVTGCDAIPGDRVELFGPNLSLDDAAASAGTAPYELLTRIGARVRRRHLGEAVTP